MGSGTEIAMSSGNIKYKNNAGRSKNVLQK
jgi:hypothetical protein